MGQQQFLLIILGIIVIGIAIAYGTSLFSSNAEKSNKDQVILDCINLGTTAQQYYKKSVSMGGGGNSFNGWRISSSLDTTANGIYQTVFGFTKSQVVILGFPLKNKAYNWQITATVDPNSISITIKE